MPIPEINLDHGDIVQSFSPSSAGSAPNKEKDKYLVDEIKDPTPFTLMYVKGRTSRTIKVAEATVMSSCILHGWSVPADCAVVEVTMIREGREFEDLDYPNEEEGIEKLVDAKGTFILWPRKDIIVKTRLSSIVSPQSTAVGGTPTSSMSKPSQNSHTTVTPPPVQDHQNPELQESLGKRPASSQDRQGPELQESTGKRPPSPSQDPQGQSSRTRGTLGGLLLCLLLLLETKSSSTTRSLGCHLLLLNSQSSKIPQGKGRLLLLLKTKSSMRPWGKGHLLLLPKTFICILLQSNQGFCLALIEKLSHFHLHSSQFMRLLSIVCLVAFFVSG
jgi:hypothetical protein